MFSKKNSSIIAVSAAVFAAMFAASTAQAGSCSTSCSASKQASMPPASSDIVDTAVSAGKFNTLVAAVKAAGLVDVLKGDGPLTVFAPTDAAFAKLPEGTVESLLKPENKEQLVSILTYHVVSGKVPAKVALTLNEAKTVNGEKINLQVKNGSLYLNDAKVIATDIMATNGVIHVIDSVLLPPQKMSAADSSARELIREAIKLGAPQYNHGNHKACADIYAVTTQALVKMDIADADKSRLQTAMHRARHQHSVSQQAWTYRHAFDTVLHSQPETRMMTIAQN